MIFFAMMLLFITCLGLFWLLDHFEDSFRERIENPRHLPHQWNEDDPEFLAHIERKVRRRNLEE